MRQMKTMLKGLLHIVAFMPMVFLAQAQDYRNAKLPIEARVKDLVSKLTLEEKVYQMLEVAPAIPRLNIPAYNWWNEALHGVARSGDSVTVFPQAIAMAATFNVDAVEKMGQITSDEARAIYNKSLLENKLGERYKGLTFWTPNINIFRDPRWGRGQETYGEDPYLTSRMGTAIVKGLQGNDPRYLKTSACAKHFAVHSGPEATRHVFDVSVSNSDLWNTYLPAFEQLVVGAKVSSVMCAYNRFQGSPCCGSKTLMMDILRNRWHFKGYVTSDCGAITDFWKSHKTYPDTVSASVKAVLSGTDLECGEFWNKLWNYKSLVDAVKENQLDENKLNESVVRLFTIRFRLGMFDAPEQVPFSKIPYSILKSKAHADHALQMAKESIVLLKNNQVLPLSKQIKTIAIVGPNANDASVQYGNYNGIPLKPVTPLEAIKEKLGHQSKVIYVQGITHTKLLPEYKSVHQIVEKVAGADVVLFVGGISALLEGEEGDAAKEKFEGFYRGDRTTIALPKIQTELIQALKSTRKSLVFVNMSGSAIGMEWEAEHVDAILQAWYGGQSAGTAIADVLFGDYNPSGRLPVTFYKSDSDLPDFSDYSMKNRTYRYFKGMPRYAFGYGLSYTTFDYGKPTIDKEVYAQENTIKLTIPITNTGRLAGDEVVEVYIKKMTPNANDAIKALKSFKKVFFKPAEKQVVTLDLPIKHWAVYNESIGDKVVEKGKYEIQIARSSNEIIKKVIVEVK